MPHDHIVVRGAREHNLKNIDVTIPRDKLVVITGLSGSGKSSLAFDTIFAEGQRRYVESLSAYARQFLGQMEKPDVDGIDGLSPAISIDQKSTTHNPRSTVGTVTEVYDYLRLLFARVGHQHCPNCGREVTRQSVEQIADAILALPDGTRVMLLAPIVKGRKGEYKQVFEDMRRSGYVRARVDGEVRDLSDEIELDKYKQHTIEVVVDRLVIRHTAPVEAAEPSANGTNGTKGTNGANGHHGNGVGASTSRLKLVAEARPSYNVTEPSNPDDTLRARVADSVETTLKLGSGVILVSVVGGEEHLYSEKFACVYCGLSLEELAPRSFSFNSPHGACPECTGLGTKLEIDESLVVTNPDLSLSEGAILPWSRFASTSTWYSTLLGAVAERFGFSLETPWRELSEEARQLVLHGSPEQISFFYRNRSGMRRQHASTFEGVIPNLMRRYREGSETTRQEIEEYMSAKPCPVCRGARLKPESLAVTVGDRNIVQIGNYSIVSALRFFDALTEATPGEAILAPTPMPDRTSKTTAKGVLNGKNGRALEDRGTSSAAALGANPSAAVGARQVSSASRALEHAPSPDEPRAKKDWAKNLPLVDARAPADVAALGERELVIGRQILKEIKERLGFLVNVGLDYLTLNRAAATLSGGEAQRIRLATQIGSSLMGVLYILDEPSIGLHQRDNARLIDTLIHLRDLGNTLLVVEHDEETMQAADHVIDMGPGAGEHGGHVVAEGTLRDIMANPKSLTGQFLSGTRSIPIPARRREGNGFALTVRGARENNLKNIDVTLPLGKLVLVTGVSGSGKSSLVNEILHKRLAQQLNRAHDRPGEHDAIEGVEFLDKVINIDQSPIGRTPRSNPATYTGAFTHIRELFAQMPEARLRGYLPGRFSFNVKGGRCEVCKGEGMLKIEMNFLPDVYVACEACKGKRYNREALEIRYKGKTIADVLDMTVEEACAFFAPIPSIANKLNTLNDVGLGYIRLGQPATTLSGGEAQRIKLASELSRRATGRTMYILDEPTTGLHFADVERLLNVLQRLVDSGNTVTVIEHNLDVIKCADWIVDLGPEGGERGGEIVAEGTPEQIARDSASFTGHFLAKVLPAVTTGV